MKNKKESKGKEIEEHNKESEGLSQISNKADMKAFLTGVRERLFNDQAAPIFAMVAMKQILSLDNVYDLLDGQSKEILQEIWVKLSKAGFHLRKPPMIFADVDVAGK